MFDFDVLVIGGGHAGCEAALAAARVGGFGAGFLNQQTMCKDSGPGSVGGKKPLKVALLTLDPSKIGVMSCNPAIGGLAKGQLVKEVDALGGAMGINTDKTAIQYRRLNSSKGPAVRSSRAQCDKALYPVRMQEYIKAVENITVLRGEAAEILVDEARARVTGVRLRDGSELSCGAVVITSGTFLAAIMHTGRDISEGGRVGEAAAQGLSGSLRQLGFRLRRLKTGTPPRLEKATIDWSVLEEQPGDLVPLPFSFYGQLAQFPLLPQVSCYITYTNEQTHEIIRQNLDDSPMFSGQITGIGPRYCPSIEDKVFRFRDKSRHQIFLEPEGLEMSTIYVNGVSTSLSREVQTRLIRSVRGLERAEFQRYGYAVEYDAVDARQLGPTLESKDVSGLFLAGQVNGTSGYEEAAAQGWVAGANAALKVLEREAFLITRDEGYIGVMVDDLTTKGSDEPYRMFTSRAEFRLLLREDNADLRLSERAYRAGFLGKREFEIFSAKKEGIARALKELGVFNVSPTLGVREWFAAQGLSPPKDRVSGLDLLKRPELGPKLIQELGFKPSAEILPEVWEQAEIQVKYEGYIQRDRDAISGVQKNERTKIPGSLDFDAIPGLSNEVKARLKEARPVTLGQASRVPGVTPAAAVNLMIYLKMRGKPQAPLSAAERRALGGAGIADGRSVRFDG